MRRHRGLVVFALLGASCAEQSFISATLPSEADWIATLEFEGASARVAQVGRFVRVKGGAASLDRLSSGKRIALIGYSEAALEPLLPSLEGAAFREALGCEPTLPPPTYFADVDNGSAVPRDPASAPRLASSALSRTCPGQRTEPFVERVGRFGPCGVAFIEGDGRDCERRFHLGPECEGLIVDASLYADGRSCVQVGSCLAECADAVCASPTTSECSAQFRVSWARTSSIHVEQRPLVPADWVRPDSHYFADSLLFDPREGWSNGLVLSGRSVITSIKATVLSEGGWLRCAGRTRGTLDQTGDVSLEPSLLQSFDADTLHPVETATAPPCLGPLVSDGSGGFFAPFAKKVGAPPNVQATWMFGHFGADLKLQRATSLLVERGSTALTLRSDINGISAVAGKIALSVQDPIPRAGGEGMAYDERSRVLIVDPSSLGVEAEAVVAGSSLLTTGPRGSLLALGQAGILGDPSLHSLAAPAWTSALVLSVEVPLEAPARITALRSYASGEVFSIGYRQPFLMFRDPSGTTLLNMPGVGLTPVTIDALSGSTLLVTAATGASLTPETAMFLVDAADRRWISGRLGPPIGDVPYASAPGGSGVVFVITALRPSLLRVSLRPPAR